MRFSRGWKSLEGLDAENQVIDREPPAQAQRYTTVGWEACYVAHGMLNQWSAHFVAEPHGKQFAAYSTPKGEKGRHNSRGRNIDGYHCKRWNRMEVEVEH
jgi:hypothetical protein